ncbi:MAG TPA: FMN-binding protein, partial [Acidimicrobiales bacterium]
ILRRAAAVAVATIAGLIALLSYKSGPVRKTIVATAPPDTTAPPDSTAPPGTTAAPPAGPTTPSTTVPPSGRRVVTGPDEPNQYGDVQVQLTIAGGRIVDVQALQLPQDRQRSAEISQAAGPLLRSEVLQAQSANIDGVSGATYTSESYAQSVQAALDQARR